MTNFIVNNIYRNYETFKKIIIDRNINFWILVIDKAFEILKIKYKDTTLYYFCINKTIKRFNNILNQIFIKYCIDQSIKYWNKYLNQTLFVIRICTHITIDFFSFYLLYNINFTLANNINILSLENYNKCINSILFLSKNCAKIFKKTIQRAKKNKVVWNTKIKDKIFLLENKVLIRIKKSKKFEIN